MTKPDWEAFWMMRVWNVAKVVGKSPGEVLAWDADEFAWAEAIEGYQAEELRKAQAHRRR